MTGQFANVGTPGADLLEVGFGIDVTHKMVEAGSKLVLRSEMLLHSEDIDLFVVAIYRAMKLTRRSRQNEARLMLRRAQLFA